MIRSVKNIVKSVVTVGNIEAGAAGFSGRKNSGNRNSKPVVFKEDKTSMVRDESGESLELKKSKEWASSLLEKMAYKLRQESELRVKENEFSIASMNFQIEKLKKINEDIKARTALVDGVNYSSPEEANAAHLKEFMAIKFLAFPEYRNVPGYRVPLPHHSADGWNSDGNRCSKL